MYNVKYIMSSPVFSITSGKSVSQAAEYMQEHQVGGLPVIEGESLVGIITSKDVRFHHPNRIVADSMTSPVISCEPDDTIWEAAELLQEYKIERMPVMEHGKVVGMITKSTLMKSIGQLYDSLTGIYNSGYIYQVASKLLSEGHEISVVLFDIDNFGQLNKKYGHIYGDRCLKQIAKILKDNSEVDCDFVCRYGGDEFVLVSLKKIGTTEKMVKNIIDSIIIETSKTGVPVTVSAGICGGQRKYARNEVKCYEVIENLINKASLASTKAKTAHQRYIVEAGYPQQIKN
ncbi:diguanylate cyclase (GGDEF) domain-containing protein [Desulfotomaculum arcticum]|uniref:Diguanylate cyclase (GGDEF) domain-containing protein n=1 Tax=Desulfotruncus arcticus DSM 17038 TaxID=1121424 RepID=A0A1I2TGJ5_9FIRM|nr:GGDEF domain-containing protein [Desulfotruncus arcticus]SFG64034.1 diguanylate cyclase (GGDEF) domain-containing protein [Desulfotomaculum arcticum] [Desulfotruncus arcticus DSM 17038]